MKHCKSLAIFDARVASEVKDTEKDGLAVFVIDRNKNGAVDWSVSFQ